MGMKRSWRAARRVALRRSGDSSHHPADTIACTATAEAGARVLPAAPVAPPPGLAPRSPHSPSPLPAKVSDPDPMGPPGLRRFFMARLDFYALLSQALCPLLDPVTAARHLFSAVPPVSVPCPQRLSSVAFISTTHFHPRPLVSLILAAFLSAR